MSTTVTAPTQNELIVTKEVFDLDQFNEVKIGKKVAYEPITTIDQALDRMANDQDRLVKIINSGLAEELKREARQSDEGWHSFDDEGKLNGPYDGTVANPKKVNIIVLGLAKSVFGFNKDMTKEQKRSAKEMAMQFVKSNETIREGLKKNAAFTGDEDDEE
jgi:hypothetical protein